MNMILDEATWMNQQSEFDETLNDWRWHLRARNVFIRKSKHLLLNWYINITGEAKTGVKYWLNALVIIQIINELID